MIIGINESGEKVSSASARISTTSGDAFATLEKSQNRQKNLNLINKVLSSGHYSIAEHTVFNIAFCNVSAVVEQFMIEFRLASFTVKSRRYVNFSDAGFYTPQKFLNDKKYEDHINRLFALYSDLIEHDVPKEDARFLLPYSFYSNFYATVNARELLHMIKSMLCGHGSAFQEIHSIGKELLSQALEIAPAFFDKIGDEIFSAEDLGDVYVEPINISKKIEILNSTPDAIKILDHASMVWTGKPADVSHIVQKTRPRELEQLTYTIKLGGLSLSSITHLVRHRMQSVIIPPLTAVNHDNYIVPDSISALGGDILERYEEAFQDTKDLTEQLRSDGATPHELAYLILSGHTLNVITTMNARELLLFFKLRTCNRAQWEIREYAIELLEQLRSLSGDIFGKMGATCFVQGSCAEGRLTCGEMHKVIEKFRLR